MRKRALVTALCTVALIGVVGVGATLAYFTDSENATNVVTMGKVDISLEEPGFEANNPDFHIEDVLPGQSVPKDPTITVAADSQPAYLRAEISFMQDGMPMNPVQASELEGLIESGNELLVDNDRWVKGEGNYYYFQDVVEPGGTVVLFDTVTIPKTWGSEVSNMEFDIVISAEAIQADNFEPSRNGEGKITAWTYSDGTAITAETYVAPEE